MSLLFEKTTHAGKRTLIEQNGQIIQHTTADLTDHVEECKKLYNASSGSAFMKGDELMVETHCIPEIVYYTWLAKLQDAGVPREEWNKYMYRWVQSPEYNVFRVSQRADKIRHKVK